MHWYWNKEPQDHIHAVQVELDRVRSSHVIVTRHSGYGFEPCSTSRPAGSCRVGFGQLVVGKDRPSSAGWSGNLQDHDDTKYGFWISTIFLDIW